MAGWSSLNNSSCSFIDVEVGVFDECEDRIKTLFDQALLVFLEEEDTYRPLPAVLGDGEKVDLFKLFVLVRERGGFDSVSRKGLWESVAEELGLDCSVSPSLRLVYSKYLDRMEKWAIEKSRTVDWDNGESKKKGCHGGLLHELGDGFRGLLENGQCGKRNRAMVFGCKHVEESCSELHRHRKRYREISNDDNDDDEELEALSCVVLSDDDSECNEEEGLELSSERRGDLRDMLNWLTLVATCPHDPSIGVLPHWSRWKLYTGNECWIQATRAKKALLVQRDDFESRYQRALILDHQIMHPAMYEDDRKSTGRLRYSVRRPNLSEASFGLCSNGSLVSLPKSGSNNCRELIIASAPERSDLIAVTSGTTTDLVARTSGARDVQVSKAIMAPKKPEFPRKHVCVGRHFQARVDEWTEESGLDSDTKWLGTRIWPLENKEDTLGNDLIGKGRPDSCSCDINLSGSVECIRFHIAEKRMELKCDLGDVFFHWRFNQMGEEVSLRWTEREEKRFKRLMISDSQSFWENAAKCFRGKKREQLVSYYFNVFMINQRRYQNRVTPRQIDSDDEGPFGSVGNGYGRDAVTSVGSDIMICTENRQCHDFE